jgi:hypothetical protein
MLYNELCSYFVKGGKAMFKEEEALLRVKPLLTYLIGRE